MKGWWQNAFLNNINLAKLFNLYLNRRNEVNTHKPICVFTTCKNIRILHYKAHASSSRKMAQDVEGRARYVQYDTSPRIDHSFRTQDYFSTALALSEIDSRSSKVLLKEISFSASHNAPSNSFIMIVLSMFSLAPFCGEIFTGAQAFRNRQFLQ